MKQIIFGLLLIGYSSTYAQADKVYLKNGSLIRGTITNEAISDSLIIYISEELITVPLTLVEEVRSGKNSGLITDKYKSISYGTGWSTGIAGGLTFGRHSSGNSTKVRPSATLSQFYRQLPWLNVGLSAGVYAFRDYTVYPLSVEYYALLGKSRGCPIMYGNFGYSLAEATENLELEESNTIKGGMSYQVGLGWHQRLGKNSIQYKIGYSAHELNQVREINQSQSITQSRRINRINVQINLLMNY